MSFGSEQDWADSFGEEDAEGELVNMPLAADNEEWPTNLTDFITLQLQDISLEGEVGGTFTFFAAAMEAGLKADPSIVGIFTGITAYIGTSTVVVPQGTELGGLTVPTVVPGGTLASPGAGVLDPTSVVDALAKLGTLVPAEGDSPPRVEGGLGAAEPTNDATESAFPKLMQQCFSELRYVCTGVNAKGDPIAGILGVE